MLTRSPETYYDGDVDMEALKNNVLNDVVDVLVANIDKGIIKEADITPVADFILERIDQIKDEEELTQLLSELSSQWPMFGNISSMYKGEQQEKVESEVADGVLALAQNGKIDEAISLAKSATQTTPTQNQPEESIQPLVQ